MIPVLITKMHIAEAIRRIRRDGVPPRRGARDYCLVTNGKHFPPKYTIAVAHQIATGKCLRPDQFSGGTESIRFLGSRGFRVVECTCGGALHSRPVPTAPDSSGTNGRPVAPTRHSERCRECKIRIRELLERIYGTCRPNHRFRWPTDLTAYSGTSIHPALRNVASALEAFRGFAVSDFARSVMLAPCDFWIPQPGFVVEFDESQHFTYPRKLGLSAYPHEQPPGFSAKRWIGLCEHHDVKDNHPPYRDEQRAWYDTLRDLAPSLDRSQPTVRLYARDLTWCSLDPDNSDDRQRFSALLPRRRPPSSRTMTGTRAAAVRTASTVRVAMVFPRLTRKASNGVPPSGHGAQRPVVPTATSFAGEKVDFALFPEGYINSSDAKRSASLTKLASELGVPLLVGAIDEDSHATGRARQVLLRFEPDGSSSLLYTKHSTAKGVAFEKPDWEPSVMIPTFELAGVSAGATICHDHYLGLLPRFLARCGARLWVNPSYQNVTDIKWSSILRLRAVENRFFALCTLHCDVHGRETHPFAFAPDGSELFARPAGSDVSMPLSKCRESGTIYIIDLDMAAVERPLDWSKLPMAGKPKSARNGHPRKPVHVALRGGQPAVLGRSGWNVDRGHSRVATNHGPVYAEMVPKERILDAAACFRVLDRAKEMECAPILWNHWDRLPTDSARLATLMMGRAIECCAPIVVSDRGGIREVVELSNRVKIPARRTTEASGEAIVDAGNAWGLDNAFKIVSKHLPRDMRARALNRYRCLS